MTGHKRILLTTSAAPSQSPFSTIEKRPPIGIGFLISVLRNAGHDVFFIDNYLKPSDFLETDYLQFNRIDLVGIYANTICYRDTLRMLYKLEYLRQTNKWKGKIVVGGPHTTVGLDTIPEFVDHVVQGEGEYALLDIVEGKATQRVIHYPRIQNLDELPMPAWDYFASLPYNWHVEWFPEKPVFTMNTSRGCPFTCTFCSVGSVWGKNYTYFSAERIVSDIEYLIEHHGAKGIYFREDNFTLNKNRLTQYCNLLLEKGIKIPWACETRVSSLDRESVELMSRAGACGFYFGVESGSQRMLDFFKKGITVDQTRNAFVLCHEYGIKTAASVVVGAPTETDEDLKQTLTLLDDIKPTTTWFNVFVGIPDSNLYQYTIKNNLYEFIDDRGLVYLKGHNERTKKYYGKHINAEIPVISSQDNRFAKPKISVVMSVYNGDKYLEKAIQSIMHQSFQDFEFIIIDDASTDSTTDILAKLTDPRCRIIRNHKNLGLTRSLNIGMSEAKGEFIARMDADDISLPHRLEIQYEFLRKNPEYSLVGSSFYSIDENGRTLSLVPVLTSDQEIRAGLQKQNWFGHGSVMMRKDAFMECVGYDEEFTYAQDYDLWLRIAEKFLVANIEEPLYSWRITPECISKNKESEQQKFAQLARTKAQSRYLYSSQRPKVSVIIPTYNRPEMLADAIKSVLDQTYRNIEIIVINDCGIDVGNIIHELNALNRIIYIQHDENKGLAATRNTGIRTASGKYITYLDDDDIYYPDHLETLVRFLEKGEYKVAYTDAYRAFQEKKSGAYVVTKRDVPYSLDFDYDKILTENFIPVLCFMHERLCVDEVGLFDETLKNHEDWDLWIRMSRKFKFAHINALTCEFTWRTDGTSMTSRQIHEFAEVREIIKAKYSEKGARVTPQRINGNPATEVHEGIPRSLAELPDDVEALLAHGKVCISLGRLDEAERHLRAAISHAPNAPRTLHQYAILQHVRGNTGEAIVLIEGALRGDPENAELMNDLGTLNYQAGKVNRAIALFSQAIAADPDLSAARMNLADLYAAAGQTEKAEDLYQKILAAHPDDTEALAALAGLYETMGRVDEASACHDKISGIECRPSLENHSPVPRTSSDQKISDRDHKYEKGICNICGSRQGFSLTNPENPRESWVCLSCGSTSRDRMYIYALSSAFGNPSPLISWPENTAIHVLEAAGARAHPGILNTKFSYLNTLYNPEKMADPDYDRKRYADFQALHFNDDSFDVVMSSDVFEHIRLHKEALKEIFRVLKPGGIMVLQAPFHPENKENIIRVRPEGDEDVFLCPPTYHDEDTLVYRVYGAELISEIESAGFAVEVIENEIPLHGITLQNIILAQKPGTDPVPDRESAAEYSNTASHRGGTMKQGNFHPGHGDATTGIDQESSRMKRDWNTRAEESGTQERSKKPMLASIVIPVFNQLEYTRQCLDALKKHTSEALYELIIVDNNSTDGTHEYLSGITGNVKILTNNENQGFTIACNQGAREAQGEYIVFLNNDTIPLDGWLTALTDTFKLSDDIGAVGSKLIYPDMRLQEAGGIIFSDGNGWNFGRGDIPDHGRYSRPVEVDYCSGASLAVRKDLYERIGGFDEIYAPAYYEDTDLCFSLREIGYRVLYQPESEVIHCEGKTAGSSTASGFKKYQVINLEKFRKKWAHRLKDQGPSPYEGAPKPFTADRNRRLAGFTHSNRLNGFEGVHAGDAAEPVNFLIIDPFLPIYDKASGSFRLFQIVKILANTPQVHVTYIARHGHHGEKYIKLLTSLGVEVYHTDPEKLFSFDLFLHKSPINLKYILSQRHYHYAFLSFYEIATQYLPDIRLYSPDTRVIIDTVDIHFLREQRQAELYNDEALFQKARNTKKNETDIYQRADALITVTEQDAEVVRPYFPDRPIYVIPNIHPVHRGETPFNGRSGVIFIGNYYHPPNVDAVEYYLKEIHPKIQAKGLSIPVSIIGDGLPERVKDLGKGNKGITFTGWVPETGPFIDNARISMAPLRYGAGMKGKVGEALAAGLPVVTTPIGAEGMGLKHGQNVMIAHSAEEFADMIVHLYEDAPLWERLSANGIQFIEENYSTDAVAHSVRSIFQLSASSICAEEPVQDKKPRITSIIIPCFNQLDYTKKCLQSIEQHTAVTHEIILIDNGSTDGTRAYLEKYAKDHEHVRLILNKKNLGFAVANNQAMQIARGDYIMLLNNDVVVTDTWLDRMIGYLEQSPDIAMVGPMSNAVSGYQLVQKVSYGNNIKKMQTFARNFAARNSGKSTDIMRLVGFCLLIRKEVLDVIGGLDENYISGNFEDDDLCLRSFIAGYRNVMAGDVFVHHYGNMTFKGNAIDYRTAMKSNLQYFSGKWKDFVEVSGDQYTARLTRDQQIQKLLAWGEERFVQGDVPSSIKLFQRTLQLDKTNSQALNNLGVIQWQTGDVAAAMKTFQIALTINPKDPDALGNLVQAAIETGRFDLLKQNLLDILKQAQPENPDVAKLTAALQATYDSAGGPINGARNPEHGVENDAR
jgi:GT2 family glycosyltransferase/radical SAM superfamily enzyme YgiQ (UPF0313 family)/Tfp pilus assembly protein PilF/glycosyltransferase involved in cell wall biosynthesis/SAM-dependent methyltransferase